MTQSEREPAKQRAQTRRKGELGPTMSGSEILVACLEREGVDTIFAYPGGASQELHQSLARTGRAAVFPFPHDAFR